MTQIDMEEIINSSPIIVFLWKAEKGWPVEYVTNNILQFGYMPSDFTSGSIPYANMIHPDDLKFVQSEFDRYCKEKIHKGFTLTYRILTKYGDVRWVNERTLIERDKEGNVTYYQGIILDVTEQKKTEEELKLNISRLEALLQLGQMTGAPLQDITDFALEEGIRLTGSKVGYLAFLSADENVLIMHSWSRIAMKVCKIRDKPIEYPLENTGLWGEAVRQRKPIITNDYFASDPLKKGYPEGHVEIRSHMNIPVFDGDKIVAVAGVGNKEEDYDESDIRQLTLLMQGMWTHIKQKWVEDAARRIHGPAAWIQRGWQEQFDSETK